LTEISEEKQRCALCGDVVGVYEPAVIVVDGLAFATSLARPVVPHDAARVYHRACSADAGLDP
jgi:hypothetical protein